MAEVPKKDRDLGLPVARTGDRKLTKYDPDLAFRICERIAEGETLKDVCKDAEMPARQTFNRWVVNQPELSRAYSAARELSAYALEEEALDLAGQLARGSVPKDQIRALDVAMNQYRWSAAKRNAKVFSEKASVSFTVPIQINTDLDMGKSDAEGAPDHPNIYQIEATVETGQEDLRESAYKVEMQREDINEPLAKPNAERKERPAAKPKRRRKRGKYGPDAWEDN